MCGCNGASAPSYSPQSYTADTSLNVGDVASVKYPGMTAAYTAGIAALAATAMVGVNRDVALPGGMSLRAPLGMAVHAGLSSYVSDVLIKYSLDKYYPKHLARYSNDIETGLVTSGLLAVAQDTTIGPLVGGFISGISHIVASGFSQDITWDSNSKTGSPYGGQRMYSSGGGHIYGMGCGSGCGQTASPYTK